MSELIFVLHAIIIAIFAILSLILGQSMLTAFICIQCILANLFVLKQTTLFTFTTTCADTFTIGAIFGLNLLQEYFGKESAKKAIWSNFLLLIFYTIMSQIHLAYTPTIQDITQMHFMPLLSIMPRITIASFVVYLFTQILDYHLYGFFKRICHNKFLILRNYASIAICQLIDTVLFSFLGLYGIVDDIMSIIVVSYLIKLVAIFMTTPFVAFSRVIYSYYYKK